MHHVALDRSGADDGHLDDEIVEVLRLEPGQHAHLRAGFHLEDAHAVGVLEHRVGVRVLRRNRRNGECFAGRAAPPEIVDEVQRLADGRQHAEPEHVHLEEPEGFEVVLVPLDDGAILHGRVLDRHEAG